MQIIAYYSPIQIDKNSFTYKKTPNKGCFPFSPKRQSMKIVCFVPHLGQRIYTHCVKYCKLFYQPVAQLLLTINYFVHISKDTNGCIEHTVRYDRCNDNCFQQVKYFHTKLKVKIGFLLVPKNSIFIHHIFISVFFQDF